MKTKLNMDKIAKALGAVRVGKVKASGGYFGATQLVLDIQSQFKTPQGGGRATNPNWKNQRLIRLSPEMLQLLRELAEELLKKNDVKIEPMQLAALLLQQTLDGIKKERSEVAA